MDFSSKMIFFFSALGAFNGFLLSFYFAITAPNKKFSNYFLACLLLTLSIRVIKSVFFYFNPNLSGIFIEFGLSACVLIGPFLYLYLNSQINGENGKWLIHILPFIIIISLLSYFYPFRQNLSLWGRYFVRAIYLQWLIYLLLSFIIIKPIFAKLSNKNEKLNDIEIWQISIFLGVSFIWLSYNIGSYTSYIVGALSFSFILYLMVLLFIFRSHKNTAFFEEKEKYQNKKIDEETIAQITSKLAIIKEKELFKNSDLKLADLAKELNLSPHTLSQFLNNNLGKSFSLFINEYRIEKAKELLATHKNYSMEAIGYDAGFNSKSTFFTTFKKLVGETPLNFKV